MKRKSEAQLYLERVEMLDTIIKNKLIEKQQWHDLALSITASMDGERVQSSGAKSKMAEAVHKCLECEDAICDIVGQLVSEKQEITQTIEQIDNPTWYDVLHKRYIQYLDFDKIAEYYGKDYGWSTTNHGRALKQVEQIMQNKKREA